MATVNITVDQNADTTVDIADVTAGASDQILVQFFADGKNMFNKASAALGGTIGDVVNVAATKYQVKVLDDDALILQGVANTYKMYKIVAGSAPTLKNQGAVTVTPLSGTPPVVPSFSDAQIKHVYPGQTLADVAAEITDAAADKIYEINFHPGAEIGEGFIADPYVHVNFIANSARGLDFEDADLSDGIHILSGLDVTGADFSAATLPTEISNKPTDDQKKIAFKDTVGKFSGTTTTWTDGDPISLWFIKLKSF